jgi:heme oxygenase
MKFTERLYLETKESHTVVDKHPFVALIRKNDIAAKLYIDLNKICIYELQKTLKIGVTPPNDVNILQTKLFRDIDQPDMFINEPLNELLILCKQYPLALGYQFYLGLLFGGNMLKKMIRDPVSQEFLTYTNSKQLIIDFKDYLDQNITEPVKQEEFINVVNKSYKLIKLCFDTFVKKCN